MRRAHAKAVACCNLALPLLDPPGERVAIPYEGSQLYGNLRRPAAGARAPVMVMCMGLDSAKEEMATYERRIKACIALSGPYDLADAWGLLPELTRETFRVRAKRATEEAAREYAATLSLKGIAGKITCPYSP